jgi:hypothetical protein
LKLAITSARVKGGLLLVARVVGGILTRTPSRWAPK